MSAQQANANTASVGVIGFVCIFISFGSLIVALGIDKRNDSINGCLEPSARLVLESPVGHGTDSLRRDGRSLSGFVPPALQRGPSWRPFCFAVERSPLPVVQLLILDQ